MMDTKEREGEEALGTSDQQLNQRHLFVSDMVAETAMLWLDRPKAVECSTAKRSAPKQEPDVNQPSQLEDVESGPLSCANQEPLTTEQESGEILQKQLRVGTGSELEEESEEILQEQQKRGGIGPDPVGDQSIVGSESCGLEREQSTEECSSE